MLLNTHIINKYYHSKEVTESSPFKNNLFLLFIDPNQKEWAAVPISHPLIYWVCLSKMFLYRNICLANFFSIAFAK